MICKVFRFQVEAEKSNGMQVFTTLSVTCFARTRNRSLMQVIALIISFLPRNNSML